MTCGVGGEAHRVAITLRQRLVVRALHVAVIEGDLALRELAHEMQIVRGDHHRDAHFLEALEQLHHFEREVGIEIARGLIGNENAGAC